MRRIYCAAAGLALIAGCASKQERVEPAPEPAQGTLVHQTTIETRDYAPDATIVRTPETAQYMVVGTWRWKSAPPAPVTPCKSDTCPVMLKPDLREIERQQVPDEPFEKGEK